MPRANVAKTNFASGEVSPLLTGRVDTVKYNNGAKELTNLVVLPQGGAWRRPGTIVLGEVADSTVKVRLIPFQFSTTQNYLLELGDNTLRIWANDALVDGTPTHYIQGVTNVGGEFNLVIASHGYETGDQVIIANVQGEDFNGTWTITKVDANNFTLDGSTYGASWDTGTGWLFRIGDTLVLDTPWGEDDLEAIFYAQSADIIWMVHPDYPPHVLRRYGANNWSLDQWDTKDGPYLSADSEVIKSRIIDAVSASGVIEIHTSNPHRLTTGNFVTISDVTGTTEANGDWEVLESNPNSIRLLGSTFSNAYTGGGLVTFQARVRAGNYTDTASVRSSSASQPNFTAGKVGDYIELPFENDWVLANITAVDGADSSKAEVDLLTNWVKKMPRGRLLSAQRDGKVFPSIPGQISPLSTVHSINSVASNTKNAFEVNYSGVITNEDIGKYVRKTAQGVEDASGTNTLRALDDGTTSDNWVLIWAIRTASSFFGYNASFSQALGSANVTDWTYTTEIIQIYNRKRTARVYSDAHLFQSTDIGRHIRMEFAGVWTWGKITAINDVDAPFSNYADVDLFDDIPVDRNTPTLLTNNGIADSFRLGAWSDTTGWPACVAFHEQRLTFARTNTEPQTIWMSTTGDFPNFSPSEPSGTVVDDNSVVYTMASTEVNSITWIKSGPVFLIGTIGGEWQARASSSIQEPITPSNITVTPQTTIGSLLNSDALRVGHGVLFLQRGGQKMYDLIYNFELDSWQANDITIISEHILKKRDLRDISQTLSGKGIRMAYQRQPHNIVWVVTERGHLAGLTFNREQEVAAWHYHEFGLYNDGNGGSVAISSKNTRQVESLCVIPNADGTQDDLYLLMKNDGTGPSTRYIVKMDQFFNAKNNSDKEDIYHLDCGIKQTYGSPQTVISGLDMLEGLTVEVYADGVIQADKAVSSGSITIDTAATKVHVGLPFISRLTTLAMEGGSSHGTSMGKRKRSARTAIRFYNTIGFKIGSTSGTLDEHTLNSDNLYTGEKRVQIPGSHNLETNIVIQQDKPIPMTVLAIWPEQSVKE